MYRYVPDLHCLTCTACLQAPGSTTASGTATTAHSLVCLYVSGHRFCGQPSGSSCRCHGNLPRAQMRLAYTAEWGTSIPTMSCTACCLALLCLLPCACCLISCCRRHIGSVPQHRTAHRACHACHAQSHHHTSHTVRAHSTMNCRRACVWSLIIARD